MSGELIPDNDPNSLRAYDSSFSILNSKKKKKEQACNLGLERESNCKNRGTRSFKWFRTSDPRERQENRKKECLGSGIFGFMYTI